MAGIIVSTIVNIVLDYAMINGHFGFAAMGIKGAAIASILAEVSYVLVSYGIIFYKKLNTIFDLHLFVALHKKLSVDTLRLASPVILQYFFSIGSWMLFYFYVEHLGKDELAISQVLRSVFGIVGAGSWAMASTCNTMVGNLMGQKKFDEIFTVIARISLISFLLSLIFGIFYLVFPTQLFSIYTNDATLIAKAIAPMKVVVIANFLLAISTVVFNAVLGTGNTRMNVIIEFSAIIIYISYIHFVIETKHMSLSWAWGSEFFYWLSLLIMATSYLKWGKWREKIV
jgi:Na+-driven multidrug efflux pump